MNNQPPKINEGNAYNKDVIAIMMPLFLMSFFFYGPRPIFLAIIAAIVAHVADRIVGLLRSREFDRTEISSITIALIIVLMMPASVPVGIVVVAVLMAIFVGKEAFGGYMSYPFNPAAVGFCMALVSWPEDVLSYPRPQNWLMNMPQNTADLWKLWSFENATLVDGASNTLKNGGLPSIDFLDLFLGNFAGPLGVTCCIVLIACAVFLIVRKRLPLAAPLSFIGVVAIIAFFFSRNTAVTFQTWPFDLALRGQQVLYELLASGLLFAAVFLVDEPGTLPKTTLSRLIYGGLLGFAVMMFRYYGTFEQGICFAILLMNALSGFFDRAIMRRLAKRRGAARS